jgi:hypothetical protein
MRTPMAFVLAVLSLGLQGCQRGGGGGGGDGMGGGGGRGRHKAETTSSSVTVDASGGVLTIHQDGPVIECDGSVSFRSETVSVTGEPTVIHTTMNGHAYGVRDGVFFMGEEEFGPAPAGSTVRVTAQGVFVDGERRGDTPAPR